MNKCILIVDDEAHMLRVTELSLQKGGYRIMVARNGREGLEVTRAARPDLIVMDVLMPEIDGLTALRELKQDPVTRPIPVIMLTARGHIMTRHEAGEFGAALFMTKPFSPTHLLREVQRLIEPRDSHTAPPAPHLRGVEASPDRPS